MSNSEKILKTLSSLIENGILTSKDIRKEISTDLKFKKDKLISNLDLVSREEFEVLKKLVQKQDGLIKKLLKFKKNKINKIENVNHYRDFLTTKDIVNAILLLEKKKKTGIFNIGSGQKLHLVDIINHLNKFTKKNIQISKNLEKTYLIANISKLRKIGWKQKYNFLSHLNNIFKYKILD